MYGISYKTLSKRLKELDLVFRRRFTPKEINLIFCELGRPEN